MDVDKHITVKWAGMPPETICHMDFLAPRELRIPPPFNNINYVAHQTHKLTESEAQIKADIAVLMAKVNNLQVEIDSLKATQHHAHNAKMTPDKRLASSLGFEDQSQALKKLCTGEALECDLVDCS